MSGFRKNVLNIVIDKFDQLDWDLAFFASGETFFFGHVVVVTCKTQQYPRFGRKRWLVTEE